MMAALEKFTNDDLSLFALPIYFTAIAIEAIWSRTSNVQGYKLKDTLASLSMLLTTAVVEILPRLAALLLMVVLHNLSPLRDLIERQWWAWLLLFILEDFSFYCFHRANHSVRIFWAGHVNHHSSEYFNLGTALRQGVGERLHKMVFWLWLALLGFDTAMIITMISISLFYQFWLHTEAIQRLPRWYEAIFNTPSHHRVHHASNIRYLDCNHGGVLIIWDRMFGTFSPELATEPVRYGLTTNLATYNPVVVLIHEYRAIWKDVARAKSWSDKWRYLLLAPGWSHDGEDNRARTKRQRLVEADS